MRVRHVRQDRVDGEAWQYTTLLAPAASIPTHMMPQPDQRQRVQRADLRRYSADMQSPPSRSQPSLLSLVRACLAVLTLTAIGQQFWLHIAAAHSVLNFFSYFTNLSNLIAAFVLLLGVAPRSRQSAAMDVVRYVSAVNMAVIGLVFVALLRNADLGGLLPWVNFVLHYVMPVAMVLDWMIQPPGSTLPTRHILLALVLPAAYLGYVLLRGAAVDWYPYPFLNPVHVGGHAGVALYAAGIFVTFLAVSGVLLTMGNRLGRAASGR